MQPTHLNILIKTTSRFAASEACNLHAGRTALRASLAPPLGQSSVHGQLLRHLIRRGHTRSTAAMRGGHGRQASRATQGTNCHKSSLVRQNCCATCCAVFTHHLALASCSACADCERFCTVSVSCEKHVHSCRVLCQAHVRYSNHLLRAFLQAETSA